jgi:hopene-associated glycosyltransferase HpnB
VATAAMLAWLYVLLHPARPWDFQPVSDDAPIPDLKGIVWPAVTIIIPARNEADSLPHTLPSLFKQEYQGELRFIIVDDRSTDGTADIASKLAFTHVKSDCVQVIRGAALPDGWMGKVWAMHQGAQKALADGAGFLLLTDADIQHSPASVWRLVAESLHYGLAMNSRMARLRCESPAEKLLIPPFVFFFNLLYPMRRVNNPKDRLAGAAGGCVLLSHEALQKIGGGFECIKSEVIDDVNLARQVKGKDLPIALTLSRREVVSLRAYPRTGDIWKMVRRTAFTELKYSYLRLIGAMLGLGLIFIIPFVAIWGGLLGLILAGSDATLFAAIALLKGILALAVMRLVYSRAVAFFELPSGYAWTLPIAGVLYGFMTIDSARRHASGQGVQWREAAQPASKSSGNLRA